MLQDVNPLSARRIAESVDKLRTWQLPEPHDLADLHRGVLYALDATDGLSRLELPDDLCAPEASCLDQSVEWDTVLSLLEQAEAALLSESFEFRVACVREASPAYALQLERVREQALEQLRRLRMRADFVCGGPGTVAPARPSTRPCSAALH
ncbi:MAG: hypothetical protein OEZ06_02750 [Myxococcales bacterium]|nr:hypothetical protein [Myxococcales bacterium]